MAQGGFLLKLDPKKAAPRGCYAVAFDYDEWSYTINNGVKRKLPKGTKKIVIEVEAD